MTQKSGRNHNAFTHLNEYIMSFYTAAATILRFSVCILVSAAWFIRNSHLNHPGYHQGVENLEPELGPILSVQNTYQLFNPLLRDYFPQYPELI